MRSRRIRSQTKALSDLRVAIEASGGDTEGGAVVVPVAVGEETCGGNTESVITALFEGHRGQPQYRGLCDRQWAARRNSRPCSQDGRRYLVANYLGGMSKELEVAISYRVHGR